jgi:hypothetical protein
VRALQQRQGLLCGFVRLAAVSSLVALSACSEDTALMGEPVEIPPKPPETPMMMGKIRIEETPKPETPTEKTEKL